MVNTYKCVNPKCDARIVNRILNAVSRKGLNIDGIGEAVIMLLVKEKLVNNIMGIFKLPELYNNGDIKISIPNIKNIIRNIINCQRVKLAKFIYALGIESIGEVTAQWLADTYGEEVFNLNEDQLKNQNNPLAGPEMIKHYISGIKMLEREISDLKSVLHIEMDKSTSNGVTYLITGKLYDHNKEQVPRELIISKLNSLGYVNTSTPSKAKIAILGTDHSLKKRNELKDGIKIIWAVDRDIFKIIAEL
jgi:DNA ligase (NAD+)